MVSWDASRSSSMVSAVSKHGVPNKGCSLTAGSRACPRSCHIHFPHLVLFVAQAVLNLWQPSCVNLLGAGNTGASSPPWLGTPFSSSVGSESGSTGCCSAGPTSQPRLGEKGQLQTKSHQNGRCGLVVTSGSPSDHYS